MKNGKIKLFLIDDDEVILNLYARYFTLKGLRVIATAKNGLEALEKLRDSTCKPDVIIMDYNMPFINGIETAKAIFEIDKSFKIIMASVESSIKKKALSVGIKCFYEKSMNLEKLYKKVKMVIK